MMSLLVLKKVWSWLKAYWYIPAILVAAVFAFVIYREFPTSLLDVIAKRREIHQKEVEAMDKIHTEETERRRKALETYHKTIGAIEEKYNKDSNELTKRKKNRIKKIVESTQGDPDLLTAELADQLGFDIVYPKTEE